MEPGRSERNAPSRSGAVPEVKGRPFSGRGAPSEGTGPPLRSFRDPRQDPMCSHSLADSRI